LAENGCFGLEYVCGGAGAGGKDGVAAHGSGKRLLVVETTQAVFDEVRGVLQSASLGSVRLSQLLELALVLVDGARRLGCVRLQPHLFRTVILDAGDAGHLLGGRVAAEGPLLAVLRLLDVLPDRLHQRVGHVLAAALPAGRVLKAARVAHAARALLPEATHCHLILKE
jgi:hypothetical protein